MLIGELFVTSLSVAVFSAGLLSLTLSLVCGPWLIRWLRSRFTERIVSDSARLNELHASKQNTPTMGGLLIVGTTVVSILCFADVSSPLVWLFCLTVAAFTLLGASDDWIKLRTMRKGLTARKKLVFQCLIASAAAGGMYLFQTDHGHAGRIRIPWMDGTMNLAGSYDVTNIKKPMVDFDIAINNFDVTKTFQTFNTVQTLAPVGKYVKGNFSTSLKFKTQLDEKMNPVLNTLTGGGKLSTNKVTLEGFAPIDKVADALKMQKLKKQELNNLNLSYKFENGRVQVEPFDMTFAGFKTKIGGSTGFDQTIDYVMNFEIPRSEFGGQANAVLDNLVSQANAKGAGVNVGEMINVKALIGGTVTNPTVKTGLKDAANDAIDDLKKRAEEELQKQKEELERKAREEADKLKNQAEQKVKEEADKLKQEAEKKKKELEDKAKKEAEKAKKEAEKKAKEEAEKKLKGLFK